MKRLIILMVLTIVAQQASFAQWTASGNDINNTNTGNVGINTAVPATKFSVNSGASAPTTRNLSNSITIGTGNANNNNKFLGQFGFMSYDVDFSAPKMVAYIGAEATETYDSNSKTGSVLRFFTGANGGTNPVERMVINNSGNLGIGTATPTEKLHVMAEGLLRPTFESISTTDHYRAILDFKRARGTAAAKLPVAFNDKLGSIYFWGYAGADYAESSAIGAVTESISGGRLKSGIYFSTNDGTDLVNDFPKTKMYITASGNVLINPKTNTQGNLVEESATGDGKLQVRGLIRAHEIKVETTNWPDFVFAKDYKLPSLSETENHIKEKGHLPGIPSAAEVQANGVELGEMNKKLLQKIEELTLYLIEQKKEGELQKKTSEQQQEKIKALSDKVERLEKEHKP